MFIAALFALSATATTICAVMIFTVLWPDPFHSFLLEIIIGVTAGVFSLPVLKLLTYHIGLLFSRLTTNEDLKKLYNLLNGPVPF